MLGGIFPLVTRAMFNRMTFAGASSFLGGVGALLTVVPWVLVFYGPKIRARSKFASVSLKFYDMLVKVSDSYTYLGSDELIGRR